MSDKIVFNGQEFSSVDAMPPEMRQQYDDVMRLLVDSGQAPGGGSTFGKVMNVLRSTQTRIQVNGKEFTSPDDLPPTLRAIYERTIGKGSAGPARDASSVPVKTEIRLVSKRAPSPDGDSYPGSGKPERDGPVSREVIFVALAGAVLACWLLLRRR